jgi:hypothetical protein
MATLASIRTSCTVTHLSISGLDTGILTGILSFLVAIFVGKDRSSRLTNATMPAQRIEQIQHPISANYESIFA